MMYMIPEKRKGGPVEKCFRSATRLIPMRMEAVHAKMGLIE